MVVTPISLCYTYLLTIWKTIRTRLYFFIQIWFHRIDYIQFSITAESKVHFTSVAKKHSINIFGVNQFEDIDHSSFTGCKGIFRIIKFIFRWFETNAKSNVIMKKIVRFRKTGNWFCFYQGTVISVNDYYLFSLVCEVIKVG